MYDSYVEERKAMGGSIVSLSTYKDVFYNKYNLGFFKRAKDRYDVCKAYENSQDKDSKREEHEYHLLIKNQVRDLKNLDKVRAKRDRNNTYNLSIHNYGSDLGINNI